MGNQIWIHLTPLHNLLGKMTEARVWTVYIRVFSVKNSINTPIYLVNFFCAEYIRDSEMRTKEFTKSPVAIVKVDIPVSECLVSQPSHSTNQLSLDRSCLP